MMCKFCDEQESVNRFTLDKQAGTTIQFRHNNQMIVSGFIKDENNMPYGVASPYIINYCPYCGKKLKD